jgi:ribonucleoside-diphosphate reductase alpha chain|tara:strand:- start:47 stop:532 length:486 start_codon:yes stop_codon:yes gene_type:complete
MDIKDPLTQLLIDKGVPAEPDVMKPNDVMVFSFPQESPKGCLTTSSLTALQQLETWLMYQRHWCEHKPSVTVSVKEDEWMEVGAWVYNNFEEVAGISFLPALDHVYKQAPYQEITEDEYKQAMVTMPRDIDFRDLNEKEDNTTGSQEFACTGNSCELVGLG